MPLTDLKVRSLKPKSAPFKVSDSEGLFVMVTPGGGKLWRLAYRFNGKQRSFALGRYPETSLLEARRGRDEAKRLLRDGIDPSLDRKAQKRRKYIASSNTFEAVANEWFEINKDRWVKSYAVRLRSRLEDDLIPQLGKRPIAEIEPLEVLDAIRTIEGRDAIEMAKRVMQMAGGIFRYGVATARCGRDPTADLRGALRPAKVVKHRTALSAKELPDFIAALESYDGDFVTKLAMQLLVLTFVRTSETLDTHRQTVFPAYQAAINLYLQRFGAGFRIEEVTSTNNRTGSSCTYNVMVNDHAIAVGGSTAAAGSPSFKTVLSAGDRNTLALALFFASLDQDPKRADIRPHLEAFLRVSFPADFPPGKLLGPFRGICQQRLGQANQLLDQSDVTELNEITEYGNRFHHDTNPAYMTAAINDAELLNFVQRTLAFVRR